MSLKVGSFPPISGNLGMNKESGGYYGIPYFERTPVMGVSINGGYFHGTLPIFAL